MEFGSKPTHKNLLISAHFLHKELAIRIARRAIELERLPYGLSAKPAVLKVHSFLFFIFPNFNSGILVLFFFYRSCCCEIELGLSWIYLLIIF